jgi:hypothetical protein
MAALVPVGGAPVAAAGPAAPAPDAVADPAGRSSSRTITDTIIGGKRGRETWGAYLFASVCESCISL